MGFTNYYRKFIPKYVEIVGPINRLLSGENASKRKALVDWTNACQVAFEHLKHLCSQTPILAYANYKKNPLHCTQMPVKMVWEQYCTKSKMITWNVS